MNKTIIVAIREFLEVVKTRAFFISVVIVPLVVVALIFGGQSVGKILEGQEQPPRHLALIDETGLLREPLTAQVEAYNTANPNQRFVLAQTGKTREELDQEVISGALYGYLHVPADAIQSDAPVELVRRDQQFTAGRHIRRMLNSAMQAVRFQQVDPPLDPAHVAHLQRPVPVELVDAGTGAPATDSEELALLTPFVAMFLLFMGIMQISYGLLTSVLEEKSSRVMEVLLSAVTPLQLMAGKIIGMVCVGVLLLVVWGGVGYALAQSRGYGHLVSIDLLLSAGLYFVPGFLFFAAILAAIGSACNTLKEAQALASPITILNIVPMLLWLPISQNPNAPFSVVLSFIPPITPFVMIVRVCAEPQIPLWQLVGTQAVLWVSVLITIWAAAKIFRVGVLMYGKPPTLTELMRWVRYA